MYAWVVDEFGQPDDVLNYRQVPVPEPGPGEVLVNYKASSVGFADLLIINGTYQVKPTPPFTPGMEGAGVVIAVGEGVSHLAPGDRVLATGVFGQGVFREYGVATAEKFHEIPDSMSFETAAGFFIPYVTAMLALHRRAKVEPGETVLITGGAGGVGVAMIQVAKAAGCRVLATALHPEHARFTEREGADRGIDVSGEDFVEVVKEWTEGKGAEVIVDTVGADTFERATKCIAEEGRLIVVGFAGGRPGVLKMNHLLVKNFTVHGAFYGPRPLTARLTPHYFERALAMTQDGRLEPYVAATHPLSELPESLRTLASGESVGKIVLTH